eukprot:EG_transcript_15431
MPKGSVKIASRLDFSAVPLAPHPFGPRCYAAGIRSKCPMTVGHLGARQDGAWKTRDHGFAQADPILSRGDMPMCPGGHGGTSKAWEGHIFFFFVAADGGHESEVRRKFSGRKKCSSHFRPSFCLQISSTVLLGFCWGLSEIVGACRWRC